MAQAAQSGGGSPASSGSAGSGGGGAPAAPTQQGGNAASGGGFDYQKAFEATKGEFSKQQQGMQRLQSDFEALKKGKDDSDKTLGKLREVFNPEKDAAPDPLSEIEAEMDQVIQAAYEADKRGEPIPLTARGYLAALKAQADQIKFQDKLMARLEKMEAMAQRAADPQSTINNSAYANMDNFVTQGLDRIYGVDSSYAGVKQQQFNAVTARMSQDLKAIMAEKPEAWDRMRRDPAKLQQFVNHYLRQQLPPKAVEILERENLQNTEMSTGELWNAFREAGDIQDPEKRREIRAHIRQDLLQRMSSPQRRNRG